MSRWVLVVATGLILGLVIVAVWQMDGVAKRADAVMDGLRIPIPDADARTRSGKIMGHFVATWTSGGIDIKVEANQDENETSQQFAARCRQLVDDMKAQFPPD